VIKKPGSVMAMGKAIAPALWYMEVQFIPENGKENH
jgi:hypothetical protein